MSSKRKKNETNVPTKSIDSSESWNIDSVLSNVKFSQSIAMLYVFEDNEAVVKMITNIVP